MKVKVPVYRMKRDAMVRDRKGKQHKLEWGWIICPVEKRNLPRDFESPYDPKIQTIIYCNFGLCVALSEDIELL